MSKKLGQKVEQPKDQAETRKGHKLVELREEAGFTQVELAALMGVSLTTIQSWEKSGLPNLQKYYKLAHILGCDLSELEDSDKENTSENIEVVRNALLANKH